MKRLIEFKNKRFFAMGTLYIIILTFLVYFNTLSGFFLSDDFVNLNNGNLATSLSDCIRRFIPMRAMGGYRPLWNFFFYFDNALWGNNPIGYHITNTSLHVLVSVLVFFLMYFLTKKKWLSLFTGMLFAVHPIHSEPVVWISGRMEMICIAFYLASLIAIILFLIHRSVISYLFSLFLFLASLLTKEMALSLPLVAFMLILIKKDHFPIKRSILKAIKLSLPFFLISLGYIAFRLLFYGQISIRMAGGRPELSQFFLDKGIIKGICVALRNITFLPFKTLLFPFDKAHFGNSSFFVKRVFFFLFTVPFLYIFFSDFRKIFNKMLIYGFTFTIFSSMPVFYSNPSDRYLYLPSVGYCLVVAFILWLFFEKINLSKGGRIIYGGFIILFNIAILMGNNSVRNSAAEIAYQIPFQVKQKYPIFTESNPILYIYGSLYENKGVQIYTFGLQRAFKLFYPDNPPFTYIIGKESMWLGADRDITGDFDLRYCYTENAHLMYWDNNRKRIDDLTGAFRLKLKENFEKIDLKIYPIWQSEEILNSWDFQIFSSGFHLGSPRINVPLICVNAIEIKMRIENNAEKKPERGEILWFTDKDDSGRQYSFDVQMDGEAHSYVFPVKIIDINQLDANIVRLELRFPYPQETIKIEYIRIIPFEELKKVVFPVWDFKNDYNLWSQDVQESMQVFEDAPCLIQSNNGLVGIISSRLDLPIKEIKSLQLKMRIIPEREHYPQKGKLFWITDTDENWEEQKKCLLFDIFPDEKFHTYEIAFNPANLEQSEAKLAQLKLLLTSFSAEVEIDFIKLVSK